MQNNHEEKRKPETLLLTQFKKRKKLPSIETSKLQILEHLRKKEYDQLFDLLEQFCKNQELKNEFFSQEGHIILRYILSYSKDLDVFNIMTEWFSINSIQAALKNNNFDAINEFFITERGVELLDNDDGLHRKIRIDKFKFLLNNAETTLKEYMMTNSEYTYMTPKIKEDFIKSAQEIKQCRDERYKFNL